MQQKYETACATQRTGARGAKKQQESHPREYRTQPCFAA
jgi:hypothetical protein